MGNAIQNILDENSLIKQGLGNAYNLIYRDEVWAKIKERYNLTSMQTGVAILLTKGCNGREIAKHIYQSRSNTERHLRELFRILRVQNSRQAIPKLLLTAFAIIQEKSV